MERRIREQAAEITLAERRVAYRVRRSARRRTVTLTVDPERGLVVHCPWRLAAGRLEAILREKTRWILAKTAQAEQQRRRRASLACAPGAALPFQGAWYPLHVTANGRRRTLDVHAGTLRLALPARTLARLEAAGLPDAALREQVLAGYREAARTHLTARVAHFAPQLGVRPRALRIKNARRRWGSASAAGGLNFNWRLILAPPAVLDYVVVHELCHLLELNHSPRFWARVAAVLPGHRACQAWLREHGPALYDL